MIKAVIIDDELSAQNLLEKTLQRYFPNKFNIVGKCNSVDSGVAAIKEYNPDLVFLDIQMPDKSGFDLFNSFKNINFEVIFVTAYNQFAIKAIQRSALDYLLKPVNHVDLGDAIKRFEAKQEGSFAQKKLALLLENLNVNDQNVSKIAFPTIDGFELVHSNQILYCRAEIEVFSCCCGYRINNTLRFFLPHGLSYLHQCMY